MLMSLFLRFACFAVLWLVLGGARLADWPALVLSATLATWLSVILLPPRGAPLASAIGVVRLLTWFGKQAVLAGIDVARRAFDPALPLRPGFVTFRTVLPPGPQRGAYLAIASLLPGSLPVGEKSVDAIVVHCLDVCQPNADVLREGETLYRHAVGHNEATR
jgi:multicomponent Na+:H+ antiporter subunit E